MRIVLLSVRTGRSHSREADALTVEYLRRISRPFSAQAVALRTERALLEEVDALRRAGATALVCADGTGTAASSEQFAAHLQNLREAGKRTLAAAVGPADGWSAEALKTWRSAGAMLLSLGPMTLPHELARLVLAEQLYRATTILAGHPYHLGHE